MKLIKEFSLAGQSWTAYTVSRREMRVLDKRTPHGLCSYEEQHLYIRRVKNKSAFRDAFIHEFSHAFIYATGIGDVLALGYKGDDFISWEESLVRLVTPHIATFIDEWERTK